MTPQTRTLVLVRHGQSEWNLANRFTGWVDVDLSPGGVAEARRAGEMLRRGGFVFDLAFTSVLKRAIRTLWLILDEMDCLWLPVHKRIALNERHYGALQGLDKAETAERHGAEQVRMWRRSFDVRPPLLDAGDPLHPSRDPRYAELEKLPGGERRGRLWPRPARRHTNTRREIYNVSHARSFFPARRPGNVRRRWPTPPPWPAPAPQTRAQNRTTHRAGAPRTGSGCK